MHILHFNACIRIACWWRVSKKCVFCVEIHILDSKTGWWRTVFNLSFQPSSYFGKYRKSITRFQYCGYKVLRFTLATEPINLVKAESPSPPRDMLHSSWRLQYPRQACDHTNLKATLLSSACVAVLLVATVWQGSATVDMKSPWRCGAERESPSPLEHRASRAVANARDNCDFISQLVGEFNSLLRVTAPLHTRPIEPATR